MVVRGQDLEDFLGRYGSNVQNAFKKSIGVIEEYLVDGEVVEHSELPEYGGADEVIYRGIDEESFRKAGRGVELLYESFRDDPINEDVVVDEAVSAAEGDEVIEVFVPWNTGQDQDMEEMSRMLANLNCFAESFAADTGIPFEFRIYSLEEYSELNNNSFTSRNKALEAGISSLGNLSYLPWQEFTNEVLEGDWGRLKKEASRIVAGWPERKKEDIREKGRNMDGDSLKYNSLRLAESTGMSRRVRLSPGENSSQDKASDDAGDVVPRIDEQFEGEGVMYLDCFYGPWKSDYGDISLKDWNTPGEEVRR